ncbi:hypothetical protein ACFQ07_02860 [Actinomadura adrarensis]|uniref:Transposase n=1 Tax=Actinomadura adrarensis TaxID=1819600 RepID=A0ABW3C9J3_9ACTN
MSTRGPANSKVVRLDPRARDNAPRRAINLTEEERQILLAELAEVTAELHWLQNRSLELAARVLDKPGTQQSRPA